MEATYPNVPINDASLFKGVPNIPCITLPFLSPTRSCRPDTEKDPAWCDHRPACQLPCRACGLGDGFQANYTLADSWRTYTPLGLVEQLVEEIIRSHSKGTFTTDAVKTNYVHSAPLSQVSHFPCAKTFPGDTNPTFRIQRTQPAVHRSGVS